MWTLATVLLLSVLATGAFHVAIGDAKRSNDGPHLAAVHAAADAGIYAAHTLWAGVDLDSVPVGDTLPSIIRSLAGVTTVSRALRSTPNTWWIAATAFIPDSTSPRSTVRRVALGMRLAPPTLPTDAAFTARDSLEVSGGGEVAGRDTVAGSLGLSCALSGASAGVATPDSTRVTYGNVTGAPPLQQQAGLSSMAAYSSFGTESWSDLTARADLVLPAGSTVTPMPATSAGLCNRTTTTNWGDPLGGGPCARWAPLIWVQGSVTLNGGAGQGILLADGDVIIGAGAEFHGVIVTRNDVRSAAGGGTVLGAILAADSANYTGNHSRIGHGLRVQRSTCLANAALRRNAQLRPLGRRPWAVLP